MALVPPPPAQAEVMAACVDADLVIADRRHKHRVDRDVLQSMRRCRLIQQAAVGFDSIDHRAAAELGIPVANAAGYNKDSVADWTVMAMIALLRHSFSLDRQLRAGHWNADDQMRGEETMGHELGAMTVGIIGIEVYRTLSETPLEFLRTDNVCGTIVIWTRSGPNEP